MEGHLRHLRHKKNVSTSLHLSHNDEQDAILENNLILRDLHEDIRLFPSIQWAYLLNLGRTRRTGDINFILTLRNISMFLRVKIKSEDQHALRFL